MVETAVKENKEVNSSVIAEPILDGRNPLGQFTAGNNISLGSHHSKAQTKGRVLKAAMMEAVTEKDMIAIVKKLIKQARQGDVPAIKELFDRCLGKPLQTHEVDVEVRTYTQEQCDSIRAMLASRCVNAES